MANNAFPVDFEALQKGDSISQEQIEKIYQLKFHLNPEEYRLKGQLKLLCEIKSHRPDLLAHVKTKGRGIEILADPEACNHTVKLIDMGRSLIENATKARGTIDTSQLNTEQKRLCEFRDRHSQMLSAQVRKLDEQRRREELLFGDGKDHASKELPAEGQG